jgi:hypothetical protein
VGAPGVGPEEPPGRTFPAPAPDDWAPDPPEDPAADLAAGWAAAELDLAAEFEPAAGEAAEPLEDAPAPGEEPATSEVAAPASAGAAEAPASPPEYPPPPGAAALVPAWFWLWTLRAARWAALPPQAAEASAPAVRRTKRRRDPRYAMQLTPLLPSVGERTFECS